MRNAFSLWLLLLETSPAAAFFLRWSRQATKAIATMSTTPATEPNEIPIMVGVGKEAAEAVWVVFVAVAVVEAGGLVLLVVS